MGVLRRFLGAIVVLFFLSVCSKGFSSEVGGLYLNLKDINLKTFVEYVSKVTKKNFVLAPGVGSKKISVICPRPMSEEEIYKVFESVLQVYGFAVVPDREVLKIVPTIEARRSYSVVKEREAGLKDNDNFITQVITLKYAPAEDVRRAIVNMVSRSGLVSVYKPTNLIIVCDYESNIGKILKVIKSMDVSNKEVLIRTFDLKYADSKEVALAIKKILSSLIKMENKRGNIVPYLCLSYERLNSIIVVAPYHIMTRIERLIEKLDTKSPEGAGNIHVVKLKNANSQDLAKVIAELSGIKISGKNTKTGKQLISKDVKIVSDKATNSLIITSSPEEFRIIDRLIKKLDVPRKQVFIEAVIMEVSGETGLSFGINWQAMGKISSGDSESFLMGTIHGGIGSTFDEVKSYISSTSSFSPFTFGIISFPFTYDANNDGIISSDERFYNLGSLIHAAQNFNSVNIISRPQLTVLENEEASVIVAENRPFQTKIETTDNQDYANYEYKDVGITLKVTPQINDAGYVRIKIYQEVSRVDETLSSSATYSLRPITKKRAAQTTVEVKDGDTVVIAGLIEEQNTDNNSKVPLIGDIPVLGYLFKNIEKKKIKKNLMIFITPHIVSSEEKYRRLTQTKMRYLNEIRYDLSGEIGPIVKGYKLSPPVLLRQENSLQKK